MLSQGCNWLKLPMIDEGVTGTPQAVRRWVDGRVHRTRKCVGREWHTVHRTSVNPALAEVIRGPQTAAIKLQLT